MKLSQRRVDKQMGVELQKFNPLSMGLALIFIRLFLRLIFRTRVETLDWNSFMLT